MTAREAELVTDTPSVTYQYETGKVGCAETNVCVMGTEDTASANGVTATYYESETERVLTFRTGDRQVAVAQNTDGYAMVKVRDERGERERYYGFDMALDHAGELLGVSPHDLPVPEAAADMGM